MAVLAPRDWQQQQATSMDANSVNSRQRTSGSTETNHQHPQQQQHHHHVFSYPVQQPQGSWTPSITAAPFYPSFYQNSQQQQQQPYPQQIPQQQPYFDPANAQLAQWAYQQMMFNAQHGFQQQRNNDYFSQNAAFNPFPSGTPPPHQNHRSGAPDHQQIAQQPQFNGFHPYRRPSRQPQAQSPDLADRRQAAPPNPPYKRPEASSSSSSVNSTGSRQRTNSNQSGHSGHNTPSVNGTTRPRNVSPSMPPNRNSPPPVTSSPGSNSSSTLRVPHHRGSSSSSNGSSRSPGISPPPPASTTTTTSATASSTSTITSPSSATPRPVRPSPLSQGTFTANERRMSRDDSDLGLDLTPSAGMSRSGGLKGRLRRALSFNAAQALKEETSDDESIKASKLKNTTSAAISSVGKASGAAAVRASTDGMDDASSTATVQTKKKGRAASLFNAKMNLSTDNISLSSTVSSASVMIRKLGSMGKLAKRNSLAGITSLFKDKDKKKKDKDGKKGSAKAEASEASVSHVTAELDRSDWSVGADMNGLSPAAKLARQHTLKSNAEAAAKAKAAQEAAAAIANAAAAPPSTSSAPSTPIVANGAGVPTWDKNTATRQGPSSPVKRSAAGMQVNEDGTRVMVEDDDEESDDGHFDGAHQARQGFQHADGWGEDDEEWDVEGDGEGDEDTTIRLGLERTSMDDAQEDVEPWAINARRSIERTLRPSKGILKLEADPWSLDAESYDQHMYLTDAPSQNRVRSNSYNSHPGHTAELGPLARIPSPDPDHIDGLHKHPHSSHNTSNSEMPSLPPLTFDTSMSLDSPTKDSEPPTPTNAQSPHLPEKSNTIFNHPNLNSSAPALSTMTTTPMMLTHRSATAPSKKLVFDSNLSVYDTFPASVYDRRSEPATWSRLTPALAQRIKEELNSYKMEEMEVHAASRIHTQFFV